MRAALVARSVVRGRGIFCRHGILASFCLKCNYRSRISIIAIRRAVGVSHRRLEWQTFAGIALAVHSGPSPVIA